MTVAGAGVGTTSAASSAVVLRFSRITTVSVLPSPVISAISSATRSAGSELSTPPQAHAIATPGEPVNAITATSAHTPINDGQRGIRPGYVVSAAPFAAS